MKAKRIFIVGHMGAGKSLLGKTLAEKLAWTHVDANIGMERYIGKALHEIIGTAGTEAFYQCQNDILKHNLTKENVVVTTEDSFILNEGNRKLLSSEYVIYLKVKTATQIERMADGPATLFPIDLPSFLNKLHEQRDGFYESVATTTIESKSLEGDVEAVLADISK